MSTGSVFRIGILRLTDAAPLIVAHELGYFAAENLEVSLSLEPSWANVADKLAYGLLDGVMMLPPLALALRLGLSGTAGPEKIIVPATLSLDGNTVTLAERWAAPILYAGTGSVPALETARRFAALIRQRREKPHLGVVHRFSTHNLLLRYWLATAGIDPDHDVTFTVVPPAETAPAMTAGRIDGFCAGAPWGEVAARAGLGRTVATSHAIWNHGTEKVFAVRQALADEAPDRLQAALRALLRAAIHCDAAQNAPAVAALLARPEYLNLPADIIRTSLPGAVVPGDNVSVFFANAATFPWRSHASWFLQQMARWGYVDTGAAQKISDELFRPDLYATAARAVGIAVPSPDRKDEGHHPGQWLLPAAPTAIAMGPDHFLDATTFDGSSMP